MIRYHCIDAPLRRILTVCDLQARRVRMGILSAVRIVSIPNAEPASQHLF